MDYKRDCYREGIYYSFQSEGIQFNGRVVIHLQEYALGDACLWYLHDKRRHVGRRKRGGGGVIEKRLLSNWALSG